MNFPFESVLQDITNIQARNVAFHKLDAETQRKEIAYDLYKLVMAGFVHNSYCSYWSGTFLRKTNDLRTPTELHEYLNTIADGDHTNHCAVCVRGGMMLSQIRLGNTLSPDDFSLTDGSATNLMGFTYQEFVDMEDLYEGRASVSNPYILEHPFEANSKYRLLNICLNVMVNGQFIISDVNNYVAMFNVNLNN